MYTNIAIIGASGAIGGAICRQLSSDYPEALIHAFSRTNNPELDGLQNLRQSVLNPENEDALKQAAAWASAEQPLDLVFVAVGMLHQETVQPEKSLRDLSADKFQHVFHVNTAIPALCAKHFLPTLNRQGRAVFAALSARVGSISDNRLGGWYAYRASKAALNMVIKNASIEMKRRYPQSVIVALHPGTVQSPLSEPFSGRVPEHKLFSPQLSAAYLIRVLEGLTPADSGGCFAWDGAPVEP